MTDLFAMAHVRKALRRSRIRAAILLALLRLYEANAADLARVVGAERGRVLAAIYGDDVTYRRSGGLRMLGLVKARVLDGVPAFSLTARGRRVALALAKEDEEARARRPRART